MEPAMEIGTTAKAVEQSRLDECLNQFEHSQARIGDALNGLRDLKIHLSPEPEAASDATDHGSTGAGKLGRFEDLLVREGEYATDLETLVARLQSLIG